MRPLLLAVFLSMAAMMLMIGGASADGSGSPAGCEGGPSTTGDPVATYDAGDGNTVDGVCIKSGANMFDGNKHSSVLTDGLYEDGCFDVYGVGTQVVTVTRLGSGSNCQAISHIDLILSSCGLPCYPECEQGCEENPCDVQDPPAECTPDPCDDPEPPLECDPLTEVCFEGEIIEVPESQAPEDTGDCDTVRLCIDGQFVTVPDDTAATDDCDPVRLCVDGESITVTEFEAAQLDGDEGSCTPGDIPPPPPGNPENPPEPVDEVEAIVADVSPVVEEVAALPAAGYGATANGNVAWTTGLGLALISIGGIATILIMRRG